MFWPNQPERRENFELRERLDEIIQLARQLSRQAADLSEEDLRESQLRVEWLAEEVWRTAVDGPTPGLQMGQTDRGPTGPGNRG